MSSSPSTSKLLKSYHFAGSPAPGTICGHCHRLLAIAKIDIVDASAHAVDALCHSCIETFYPDEIRAIVERGFAAFDTLPGLESKKDVGSVVRITARTERIGATVDTDFSGSTISTVAVAA